MTITLQTPSTFTDITYINCGTTTPSLSGHIDLNGLTNLEVMRCISNGLTGLYGYGDNKKLIELTVNSNKITGNIEKLDNKPLDIIYLQSNQLSGNIPNIPSTAIKVHFGNNSLTGTIPPLSSSGLLQELTVSNCYLSGNMPSLTACFKLKTLNISNQKGISKLTGSITDLQYNPSLIFLVIHSNQLSQWMGINAPVSLKNVVAYNNSFNTSAVDNALQSLVNSNAYDGVLNMGGTGNQSPSVNGNANKVILVSRGWTVTTN